MVFFSIFELFWLFFFLNFNFVNLPKNTLYSSNKRARVLAAWRIGNRRQRRCSRRLIRPAHNTRTPIHRQSCRVRKLR
jgi:hypothetical protein